MNAMPGPEPDPGGAVRPPSHDDAAPRRRTLAFAAQELRLISALVVLLAIGLFLALPFVLSIAGARGVRYFGIGLLSVWYGQQAVTFLATHGKAVALWAVAIVGLAAVVWLVLRSRRRDEALTSAG